MLVLQTGVFVLDLFHILPLRCSKTGLGPFRLTLPRARVALEPGPWPWGPLRAARATDGYWLQRPPLRALQVGTDG